MRMRSTGGGGGPTVDSPRSTASPYPRFHENEFLKTEIEGEGEKREEKIGGRPAREVGAQKFMQHKVVEDEYDVGVYNLVSVPGQIDCRRLYRYNR